MVPVAWRLPWGTVQVSRTFELNLSTGGRISLTLQAPVAARTCYILSLPGVDVKWLWLTARRILEAGGRPISDYAAALRDINSTEKDVSADSLSNLLGSEGYTFGLIRNLGLLRPELDAMERRTLVLLRDPRDIVAELRAASPASSEEVFLKSPAIMSLRAQCRKLADFCRVRSHVTWFRLEDAARNVVTFAREIADVAEIDMTPAMLSRITSNVPAFVPASSLRDRFSAVTRNQIEAILAEALACFGYVPESAPTPAFLRHWSEFSLAIASRLPSQKITPALPSQPMPSKAAIASKDRGSSPAPSGADFQAVVEPDPELMWRLSANGRRETTVLGRKIVLQVDAFGCRPVLDQRGVGEKTFAAYGCSFTFGACLPFEETFCSLLQSMLPSWRVENHGVGAYGTVQNLIQLRRASRWASPDYVTFCFIPSHSLRNVADISFRRNQMTRQNRLVEPRLYPRAALGSEGELQFKYVSHPRWDLDGKDLSDFNHDPYYLDLVTARVFERAASIVGQFGGHFFITVLKGDFSPYLRGRLESVGIPIVNAGVEGQQYTCLPDDGHPNAAANRIFAERIHAYLIAREASLAAQPVVPIT